MALQSISTNLWITLNRSTKSALTRLDSRDSRLRRPKRSVYYDKDPIPGNLLVKEAWILLLSLGVKHVLVVRNRQFLRSSPSPSFSPEIDDITPATVDYAPTLLTSTSPTNSPDVQQQHPPPTSQDGRSTPKLPISTSDDANQETLPITADNITVFALVVVESRNLWKDWTYNYSYNCLWSASMIDVCDYALFFLLTVISRDFYFT